MSPDEQFLFDLNGYLHVPNVLTPEEVALCNEGVERNKQQFLERKGALRNTTEGTPLAGEVSRALTYSNSLH